VARRATSREQSIFSQPEVATGIPDAELDEFVSGVAARIASFDTAVAGAKAQINRPTLSPPTDRQASWAELSRSVAGPGFQSRIAQLVAFIDQIGLDRVELNLGHYLGIANQSG
jgi:hypothetical protein